MFRRLWRSATGADESQQQPPASKNGAHVNGQTAPASAAAQTHADNQSAAATLHPNTASSSTSTNAHSSSAGPLPPAIAGSAAHSHPHSHPHVPVSSSSSPPVGPPPAPVVISESVPRPAASATFPVGEKFYGLENSNNVCYSNSVLQALYACRPFRQHLLIYYEDNKKRKPANDDTLLAALATLFYRIQTSKASKGVVSPAAFVKKLKKCNEQFDSIAHQDAQEFLIFLLNDLSDTIKAEKAAKDRLAVQQQQQQSVSGVVGGGATVPKKSGFASLFSSSTTPAPAPPAAATVAAIATSQHSLSSLTASSSIASVSSASHSSSHSSTHAVDGVDQLPNLSALSAATAAGSKSNSATHDTHEHQQSTTQPSTSTSTNPSSSSASTSVSTSTTTSSTATTDASTTSNHSSPAASVASTSAQPSVPTPAAASSSSLSTASSASSTTASPTVSWVQSLFEGTLTNLTSCLRCGSVSERDESFLDLSVDLLEHQSLSSCLRSFSHDEMLSGADKYLCDACGCRQEAVKSLRIKSTPAILILHMKRFKYQEAIRTFAKLTYRVTFPLSLRLPGPSTSSQPLLYSLTAVVVHIGNGARSGHYVCMCRGSSGQFYLYDDTTITPCGEVELQATFGSEMGGSHQDGYLLFYSQEQPSTRPIPMHTIPQQPSQASQASSGIDTQTTSANGESGQTVADHLPSKAVGDTRVDGANGISVAG